MAGAHIFQHHPLPLHDWLHEHQWLVSFGFGLIIIVLAAAIAEPIVSMVRAAIAESIESSATRTEVISTPALPREWLWSREAITFDHMFRDSEPQAAVDFIRNPSRTDYGSSAE